MKSPYHLKVSSHDVRVAYLQTCPRPVSTPGFVKRSISLRTLLPEYVGPDVQIDLDAENRLVGIELIG
ncbi:MAG: DUF2283 domain-containing protein [Verrucomicrobiaceae bacterium]|nr:DUF2283 domain-containing protein [Verrucomicrobiaceae bacterium]